MALLILQIRVIFFSSYNDVDDEHVDGVRPRLRTSATNESIVHPPSDI
jgi:hypothetical protein